MYQLSRLSSSSFVQVNFRLFRSKWFKLVSVNPPNSQTFIQKRNLLLWFVLKILGLNISLALDFIMAALLKGTRGPLCLSSGDFEPGWVLEESPDSACDVALEAASDLAISLALGASSVPVVAGRLVNAGAGERDDEESAVELPVAAAVEAMTILALA